MKRALPSGMFAVLVGLATAACSTATNGTTSLPPLLGATPATPAGSGYTVADVEFMAGMIPHHAQAVRMARWAETNGARADVRVLAERIIVSQLDEIELMRMWLRDREQYVPPPDATHHRTSHGGVEHVMLMPGMLTDDELAQLESARGSEFDRLFLTFMIRHHEGALVMVEQLFASPGAAQDDFIYKFASDVFADQTSEIDRMQQLLATMPSAGDTP
jgi:uncharacterized protein (DUF305 family)